MYEERERFSLKDFVLQVILVALFVLLLLWLFPTKSYVDKKLESSLSGLKPLYNQIFSQNLNNMKDAAVSYFTTSRLPKNIGDKESLTLREMLDKKLLLPFLDSNSKQCDLTKSYAEITKMDEEYILKINLSCSDNEDYILVHLGCYNYCESGLCEKREPVVSTYSPNKPAVVKPMVSKKYEYEYEKITNGKWGDWSEWSEWSISRVDKTDYRNVKTKQELVVDGTETIKVGTVAKVTDATAKVSYYCPKGYTQNGTTCSRNIATTDTKDATAVNKTTYSCSAYPGYTLSGDKCIKQVSGTDTKNATAVSKTTYSCSAYPGYTLSGDKCIKQVSGTDTKNATAVSKTTYSCSAYPGYTLSGDKCTKKISSTDTKNATKTTTYSCPSGYSRNGTICTTTTKVVSGTQRGSYIKTVTGASSVPGNTSSRIYIGTGVDRVRDCSGCTVKTVYTYDVYYAIPTYTTKQVTVNATMKTAYNCNAYSGYSLSGTMCVKSTSYTDTKAAKANTTTTYNCNSYSGYSLSGTKCIKGTSSTDTKAAKANTTTTYNCDKYSGYSLSGTKCIKGTSSTDTKAAKANTTTTYNCDKYSGYSLSGTKCVKNVTSTQTIKASTKTIYSCKNGDLFGQSCVIYEDKYETFNKYSTVTYYSYQEREFISGNRDIVWSTSQNDKNLFSKGYNLTGKNREI